MKTFLTLLVVALLAGTAGWFLSRSWESKPQSVQPSQTGRRILYYQSAMHPWIKSDQPGNCTICGMKLTPVFEGETGFESAAGVTRLPSNTVQVINVQTTEVLRQPLVRTLRVAGTIDDTATRHRIIAAYVDGRIDQLYVNFVGAEVTAGEPLATFYSPMLLAAEREYRAILGQRSSSALPPPDEPLLAAVRQRLRQFGLNEAQIAKIPTKSETNIHSAVLAPMSGTVVARHVYEGQYVKEGDPLFEIADFSTMWFVFDAYERDLPWLSVGQTVTFSSPANPGKTFQAPISFIDPNLNPATRTAAIRVELQNPLVESNGVRRVFYHKLYARGEVQTTTEPVVSVPRSAVLSPGGKPFVYVAPDTGHYVRRLVELGRSSDDFWEVTSGLEPGESVVTRGALLIDAQTQLNEGGADSAHGAETNQNGTAKEATQVPSAATPTNHTDSWSTEHFAAATNLLALASQVAEALARDDLPQFQSLVTRAQQLSAVEATNAMPITLQSALGQARGLRPVPDLKEARKAFLPFSTASVAVARELRRGKLITTRIYQCPMVDQAIAGAPKKGQWVQADGPLRNPYFGAEMIDCGTEVQP